MIKQMTKSHELRKGFFIEQSYFFEEFGHDGFILKVMKPFRAKKRIARFTGLTDLSYKEQRKQPPKIIKTIKKRVPFLKTLLKIKN
jgi:hypothetical protein